MTLNSPEQSAYKQAHEAADTDAERSSIHHTLGKGVNQAAPGNHTHDEFKHNHDTQYSPVGHEHPDYENQPITEIPPGTTVKLKKGVTGPGAPTVTSTALFKAVANPLPVETIVVGGVIEDGLIYSIRTDIPIVYTTPLAGGPQVEKANLTSHLGVAKGITKKDGFWYILGESPTSSTLKIMKFDTNWALISSLSLAANPSGVYGLAWHPTSAAWVICYSNGSSKLVLREVNANNGATILNTTTTLDYNTAVIRSINLLIGSFDFGTDMVIVGMAGFATADNKLYVFNSAYARSTVSEWPLRPSYALWSLGWDSAAGEFRQLTSGTVIHYSSDVADLARKYAGTALNKDGSYVSTLGASTDFTLDKRAWAKVVFPAVPEEVASIDTYIAKQSDSLFKKQTPSLELTLSKLTKHFKGVSWAGAAPPGASTWPASAPAKIISDDGVYYFDADGNLKVKTLTVDSGLPVLQAEGATTTCVVTTASTWTSKSITFNKVFTAPPKVDPVFNPNSPSGEVRLAVSDITATGFTLWFWRNTTTNMNVQWTALQIA